MISVIFRYVSGAVANSNICACKKHFERRSRPFAIKCEKRDSLLIHMFWYTGFFACIYCKAKIEFLTEGIELGCLAG